LAWGSTSLSLAEQFRDGARVADRAHLDFFDGLVRDGEAVGHALQLAAAGTGSAQGFTIAVRAARMALMRVFRRFFLPYQPTAA